MLYILGHMNCLRVSENGLKSYLTLKPKVGIYEDMGCDVYQECYTRENKTAPHTVPECLRGRTLSVWKVQTPQWRFRSHVLQHNNIIIKVFPTGLLKGISAAAMQQLYTHNCVCV